MIELAKYKCPECGIKIDVWHDNGEPEDIEATRCPICVPMEEGEEPVYCFYDEEASSLWSPYEEDDTYEEIPTSPEELEILQLAEELGVNLRDPDARYLLEEMED